MSVYDEFSQWIALNAKQQMPAMIPFAIGHVVAYDPTTNQVQCVIPAFPVINPQTGAMTGEYSITPWMQVGTPWVGNGWGMQVSPEVGDAAPPWSGTQCAICIVNEETSASFVANFLYTQQAVPPDSSLVAGEAILKHKSGTYLKFHDSGEMEVFAQTNVQVSTAGGISADLLSTGSIEINLPSGQTFSVNGSADALALVSSLVSAFNAHTHTDPQGGVTGTPVTQWSASTIESAIMKVGS